MIRLKELIPISEGLNYHVKNNIDLINNIYRYSSNNFFELFNEARTLFNEGKIELSEYDIELIKTDIGNWDLFEGKKVPLDIPMIESEYQGRDVDLNKPTRSSGPKKYKVYVKNKKGNVIKVNFGDAKGGLSAKINDPEARKSFADRHNCKDKKDKTKAGYWSCRLPRYWKNLGGSKNMNTYW
jgi:hypothetical protein